MDFIEFSNVTYGYTKCVNVFENISFKIEVPSHKGYIIGLLGDSGSGKSTLLKLILGSLKPQSGKVTLSPSSPILSYVPQEAILFEHMTPLENAQYFKNVRNYKQLYDDKRFWALASTLGITEILGHTKSVNEISGGQRQRISLLRALSIKPEILLLDEPLSGLDEQVKDLFLQSILKIVKELNLLVIYITHHKKEVEFVSDEILYLITNNRQPVNEISLLKTETFFSNPPTLSALISIRDTDVNILHVDIDSKKRINMFSKKSNSQESFYIAFNDSVVSFSQVNGWEFQIEYETALYIYVRIIDSETTIILKKKMYTPAHYIYITGRALLYSNANRYISNITIVNNMIK